MREYMENGIKNLKEALSWKEEELEQSRQRLTRKASGYSAKDVAHGGLDSYISDVRRQYEEVRSLRDQIETLEHLLKNAEKGEV